MYRTMDDNIEDSLRGGGRSNAAFSNEDPRAFAMRMMASRGVPGNMGALNRERDPRMRGDGALAANRGKPGIEPGMAVPAGGGVGPRPAAEPMRPGGGLGMDRSALLALLQAGGPNLLRQVILQQRGIPMRQPAMARPMANPEMQMRPPPGSAMRPGNWAGRREPGQPLYSGPIV